MIMNRWPMTVTNYLCSTYDWTALKCDINPTFANIHSYTYNLFQIN